MPGNHHQGLKSKALTFPVFDLLESVNQNSHCSERTKTGDMNDHGMDLGDPRTRPTMRAVG